MTRALPPADAATRAFAEALAAAVAETVLAELRAAETLGSRPEEAERQADSTSPERP